MEIGKNAVFHIQELEVMQNIRYMLADSLSYCHENELVAQLTENQRSTAPQFTLVRDILFSTSSDFADMSKFEKNEPNFNEKFSSEMSLFT